MRKLTGNDKKRLIMQYVADQLRQQGFIVDDRFWHTKPVIVDDTEQDFIRHICTQSIPYGGIVKLPLNVIPVPEYQYDYRDTGEESIPYEDFYVYYCPFCGKIIMVNNSTF